jgi:hypothetical protein
MPATAVLDHIVVNARTDMERCEVLFEGLGFTLTPRGYHTLGSINALAIFGTDYLELLGLPPGKEDARPELSKTPPGLNGVVFKTTDADATYAHLQSIGVAANPPKSFSRPVTLNDGSTHDVKFRTVTLSGDVFPAGRLYFCEHGTPGLVWRPEWQNHANHATAFAELVVVSPEPEGLSKTISAVLKSPATSDQTSQAFRIRLGDFTLCFQTPDAYLQRFGAIAIDLGGRADVIGAAILHAALPGSLVEELSTRTGDYEVCELPDGLGVKAQRFNTLLVFRQRDLG